MNSEENKSYKSFNLKMNRTVQHLLISSLGTCKFVMQHSSHPLTQAIREFKLFNMEHFDKFLDKVRGCKEGQTIQLTLADELLIYTALDITCKTYVTDLGDRMEQLNSNTLKSSKSSFSEVRDTILKGCQFVMENMRENLSGIDEFDDRSDILDNYVLAQ